MRVARQFILACLIVTLFLSIGGVASVRAATFVVINTSDAGANSLRDAITQANAHSGSTIAFAITGGGVQTITLMTSLPTITGNVTVDGTTEPGYAGAPLVTLDGGNRAITAFTVGAGVTLNLSSFIIQHMFSSGIVNAGTLNVANVTLANNVAISGGAINNTGTLIATGCTFQSNEADNDGAALYTSGGATITNSLFSMNLSAGGDGGAISIVGSTVTVIGSTFSGNRTFSNGGAIAVRIVFGPPRIVGMLFLINSTVSGNSAVSLGGGVYLASYSSATLTNDTVTGNSLGIGGIGGGIYTEPGATATLANTIVANNTTTGNGTGPDLSGQYSDGGHNLIREMDTSTGFTDVSMGGTDYTGTIAAPRDPGLVALPLANNGGPTPTEALLSTSIAVNHGDNTICTSQTGPAPVAGKDQRGVLRPQGSACDIGAYEYLILTLNGTTIPTSGGRATLTGTGFQPGLTLTVDGVNAPVTNVASDGTGLTATFHAHLSGNVTASVSEPAFAPASATTMLTYANFTPAVQSISPTSGSITGGASVTITGVYFTPGATVTFGNTPAQHVTVVSDTKITATTPAQSASGAVNVNVTVQGLTGTLTNGYTYGVVNPAPQVRPSSGSPVVGSPIPMPSPRANVVPTGPTPNPLPPAR